MSARKTPHRTNKHRPQQQPRSPASPATTGAQQRLAGQRAAAARERITAARRRRRLQIVGSATLSIVLIAAVLVIFQLTTGAGGPKSGHAATVAQAQVVRDVTHVPAATLNTIGAGTARTAPTKITAPTLSDGGKPEVLFVGAEYCPYCAAERWALGVAVSRFGTLHGVGETESSPTDVYPSTQTLSYDGATLTSPVLSFLPREIQGNKVVNGQYATLNKLSAAQQSLLSTYDTSKYVSSTSGGSIPFIDIAGKYLISGASYDPGGLKGKTHQQIASALSEPTSSIADAVDGTANLITAAICTTTNSKPADVCTSAAISKASTKLAHT